SPGLHVCQVVVGAVVLAEPCGLAGMFRQHFAFAGEGGFNVDDEIGQHGAAAAIDAADGVHEVEVRDGVQGRGRVVPVGAVVGGGRGETSIADQHAGSLVVAEVIDRRSG